MSRLETPSSTRLFRDRGGLCLSEVISPPALAGSAGSGSPRPGRTPGDRHPVPVRAADRSARGSPTESRQRRSGSPARVPPPGRKTARCSTARQVHPLCEDRGGHARRKRVAWLMLETSRGMSTNYAPGMWPVLESLRPGRADRKSLASGHPERLHRILKCRAASQSHQVLGTNKSRSFQCSTGSWASSITTLPVLAGSRKIILEPPWPMRQVSVCSFIFSCLSSAIASSMSSTSKQI